MSRAGPFGPPTLDIAVRRRLGATMIDAAFRTRGSVTALFGASGAGKTSIANMIAGILRPDAGHVRVLDATLFDSAAGIDMQVERRGIGYVFQDARLFPHLDVTRNLRFGDRRSRSRPRYAAFDDVVELLALRLLLARRPRDLSGGERQRVAIGRALLAQPHLLILDEPLASLDAERRGEILPYLSRLRDAFAIPMIYVSHQVDEVVRLATEVVLLDRGSVVAQGSVADIFSRADLRIHTGRRFEAGAIVEGPIVAQRDAWQLTDVSVGRATLTIAHIDAPLGTRLRIRIRARDVALALSEPQDSSISGRLPGVVAQIVPREGPLVEVSVDVGCARVWSLVTRHSVERLALSPGMRVWCLVKTVTLDNRAVSLAPPPEGAGGEAAVASPVAAHQP